ncbi:hypothetical protein DRO69_01485 [Candidatus Bathyarchaeota archaeon]|mgnify:CR=1 FL=1|nr:MAG: hypothetical protein DRO69_01485 [Candidatus Bathyarchaeota archaeon]
MAFEKVKKKLAKTMKKILEEYNILYYDEAILVMFDPYSISEDPDKTYWLCKNVTVRFYPDGNVIAEKIGVSEYITKQQAETLHSEMGIPLIYTQYTDLYDTKLEADLNRKQLTEIPLEIEVEGAIIGYNQSPLEALIIASIEKFGRGKATLDQTINYLTMPPPDGGGWYHATPQLRRKVEQKLQQLTAKGVLEYNPETLEYTLIAKPTTSKIEKR